MPVYGQTLEQALGPELGARVNAIVARYPPAPGELVALAADHGSVEWRGADGRGHKIEFEFFPLTNGNDDDDDDDVGEDDDEGWELETDDDDDEQVA